MPGPSIISIDLPWSEGKEKRTVAATFDGDEPGLTTNLPSLPSELVEHIVRVAAPSALLLLDIPIDGCERLSAAEPFRPLDRRFQKAMIPILPSVKSGNRGAHLRRMLLARRSDFRVEESYPYAVLRVLWALGRLGKLGALGDGSEGITLRDEWHAWPPKYKRARIAESRRAAMALVADLLKSVLGGRLTDLVRSPDGIIGVELDRICDEYDALLGVIAGWALDRPSPWSWRADVPGEPGSIVTIADEWLRDHFSRALS